MTQERFVRLQQLFEHAVGLAPDARAAWLDGECGADRELRSKSASSVRENLQLSLEVIEREIRDYRRFGPIFALLVVLDVIPLLNGYHLGYFDQTGLAYRLMSLGVFLSVVLMVALRHYRRVLAPRRQELMKVLSDLEPE